MSSKIRTEEVPTGHGDEATIEVVDCCSCEQTVSHESAALVVVMNDDTNKRERANKTRWETMSDDYQEGWLCEHCREDPIKWPQKDMANVAFETLLFFIVGLVLGGMLVFFLLY